MSGQPTVVIGSAGRRLYLVQWFREAFEALGIDGRVVVTEHDPTAAAASFGDLDWPMPRYDDAEYGPALLELVETFRPRLFVSVNDYELMQLHVHSDLADQLRDRGVIVPGVTSAWQSACADKLAMAELLAEIEVSTPATVRGSDRERIEEIAADGAELVVKHRFGSASSGLSMVLGAAVDAAIEAAARTAPTLPGALPSKDDVVVQRRLVGTEHGVDIVGDLRRGGALSAVLSRRKLRMRAGETDKAVTVDPEPFVESARRIARASGLTGLIDVDMFLGDDGVPCVVDINPRFGGGYPFMHLAGADVPRRYLQQAFDLDEDEGWKNYVAGVISAKHESVRVTSHPLARAEAVT